MSRGRRGGRRRAHRTWPEPVVQMGKFQTRPCPGCGWPVIWTTTEHGARMPVDPDPVREREGFLLTDRGPGDVLARFHRTSEPQLVHLSHFATCPRAARVAARHHARH